MDDKTHQCMIYPDNHGIERNKRLGKRLAYLLRYGAEKEGLTVMEGGFVELFELLRVPLMQHHSAEQVMEEIDHSTSYRGTRRFEKKHQNGTIYIRALYGRRMERNPLHEGSQVPRLLEACMSLICRNIEKYDMDGFPDEFLINSMIHKMKRSKRLSNRALQSLLCPTLEHLDLDGVYLTESSIKMVTQRCPNLRMLSLHDCGYVMTDHFIEMLLKHVHEIETLNLSGCRHLTDRSLQAIQKKLPHSLLHLNLSGIPGLSEAATLDMILSCQKLEHLDIFDNRNFTDQGLETLSEVAVKRNLKIILRGLSDPAVAPHNPSYAFGTVW